MRSARTNHTEFTSDMGFSRYKPGLSTTRMFRQDGSVFPVKREVLANEDSQADGAAVKSASRLCGQKRLSFWTRF